MFLKNVDKLMQQLCWPRQRKLQLAAIRSVYRSRLFVLDSRKLFKPAVDQGLRPHYRNELRDRRIIGSHDEAIIPICPN